MSSMGSIILTLALTSLAAGGVAWMASRLAERVLSSPRHTVWIWRAARLAALAPLVGFGAALLAPRLLPRGAEAAPAMDLFAIPMLEIPFETVEPVMSAAQGAAEAAALPAGVLILAAYGLGLLAALSRAAARRIALANLLRTARTAPEALQRRAADWRRRLSLSPDQGDLRMVDADLSPFVSGLKPVIVMPSSFVGEPGADMALAHELMHVRRGDERDRLIGEWLTTLFWFNPFAVMIERRLAGARELACDADLLDELGGAARQDYARALTQAAPIHGDARLHCAFLTDAKDLRVRRVKAILAYAPTQKGARVAAGLAGMAVLLAASPAAASAWWAVEPQAAEQTAEPSVEPDETPTDPRLSAQLADLVERINAANVAEDYAAGEAMATAALDRPDLTAYDRAVLLQLRGTARFHGGDIPGIVEDFEAAIATAGLPDATRATILVQLGQLYATLDQYERSAEYLEAGVAAGAEMVPHLARIMAQLYFQLERFEDALTYGEMYAATLEGPGHNDAMLMAAIYDRLDRPADAAAYYERYFEILEEPTTNQILTLVNFYNDAGRPDDAQRIWDEHDMAEWARQRAEAQPEEQDG
jgi:beta-lactamase regulating signal transducer with metallopeptidase domain